MASFLNASFDDFLLLMIFVNFAHSSEIFKEIFSKLNVPSNLASYFLASCGQISVLYEVPPITT